jgi:hypothetical protein
VLSTNSGFGAAATGGAKDRAPYGGKAGAQLVAATSVRASAEKDAKPNLMEYFMVVAARREIKLPDRGEMCYSKVPSDGRLFQRDKPVSTTILHL